MTRPPGMNGYCTAPGCVRKAVHEGRCDRHSRPAPPRPAKTPRKQWWPTVIGYVRVSTDRQAEEGHGLDIQLAGIQAWADQHQLRLVDVARDEGRSGTADQLARPGLTHALASLKAGRAGQLVVYRLDRLARDLVLMEILRAEVLRAGGQLRSVAPAEDRFLVEDPTDPSGKLIRRILGAIAEYERDLIRLRLDAGKARKRDAGGFAGGGVPYGWQAVNGDLVPVVGEQDVIRKIRRARAAGHSQRAIARRLNDAGVPARRGRWHPTTVGRVLQQARRRPA